MNTKNFTMEDAIRTLMNYNTAAEKCCETVDTKISKIKKIY